MSLKEDLEMLKEKIESQFLNHKCTLILGENQTYFLQVIKDKNETKHIYPVGNGIFFFTPTPKGMTSQDVISKL